MVPIGPQGHHDHPTGDPGALASVRLSPLLALEIPLSWPAAERRGSARTDPADERGKSAVGCAAHPWRAAQTRLRRRTVERGETHLRWMLQEYARYYNTARTHRSLDHDAPVSRPVQQIGRIASHAMVGGLHHQYIRM